MENISRKIEWMILIGLSVLTLLVIIVIGQESYPHILNFIDEFKDRALLEKSLIVVGGFSALMIFLGIVFQAIMALKDDDDYFDPFFP